MTRVDGGTPPTIITNLGEQLASTLRERFPAVRVVPVGAAEPVPDGGEVALVVGNALPAAPGWQDQVDRAGWVHFMSTGLDAASLDSLDWMRGRTVTNSRGASAAAIAEFVVGAILAADKRMPAIWAPTSTLLDVLTEPLRLLAEETVGIVGYGTIGQAVAARLAPFGTELRAIRRRPGAPPAASMSASMSMSASNQASMSMSASNSASRSASRSASASGDPADGHSAGSNGGPRAGADAGPGGGLGGGSGGGSGTRGGPAGVGADRVRFVDDLDELLELSDHVVLAAPLTAATRGMLGAERFARFRPGAHLVNIARGGLVDHDALLAALTDGRVGRASLDVTEPEPLPADHPLRAHPGVFLSPHVSWSGQTRFVEILLDNVGRWTAGEPLLNRVDLDQGY